MTRFTCARCTDPDAVRMRNSALCQDCWRVLAAAGLRWCPRCQTAQPGVAGYCAPCRVQVDLARRSNPDYHERKRARQRAAAAARRAQTAPESAPAPIAPQEPAQHVVGDVLGREGATVYTVGSLNGRAYVFDGPGRAYCPLAQWAASAAGRRLSRQGERSVFDEVPAQRSVWRNYAREVEI